MLKNRQHFNTLDNHSCLKGARREHFFPFTEPGMEGSHCWIHVPSESSTLTSHVHSEEATISHVQEKILASSEAASPCRASLLTQWEKQRSKGPQMSEEEAEPQFKKLFVNQVRSRLFFSLTWVITLNMGNCCHHSNFKHCSDLEYWYI